MTRDFSGKAKYCPMCGSKRIYGDFKELFGAIYELQLSCADCGLNGYKSFYKSTPIDDGWNIILDYWNSR
jgi:hypothetical protein